MSQMQASKLSRAAAWLWALVVALLVAHNAWLWLGHRVTPDTDILALLPVQERDPILQTSFTHMVDSAQQRLLILVGAEKWEDAGRAADAYSQVIATQPALLQATQANAQAQQNWLDSFQAHRQVLLSNASLEQLHKQTPAQWQETALRQLYSPFGGPKLGAWRDDPFGLFASWVQERAQETPVRPRDGRLFVSDGNKHYVLLPYTLTPSAFSISAQERLLPILKQANLAAQKTLPQVDIISTGVVLHAAAAGQQANQEVSTIGLGSLAGIVLLMWASFRSFKPMVLLLLSIGIGCLGAFSISFLWFERIHLMTLVFGASLIGVAQDYALYFLCNRLSSGQQCDSFTLLKRLMPGLILTLITTLIGYMGLAMTPFPGLRQMALFSAIGLIFAWLTVVCWFPFLVSAANLSSGSLVRANGRLLRNLPHLGTRKTSLFAYAAFALLVALGCAQLGVNDDIRLLQNSPPELITQQIRFSKLLDAPTPVQYFLVRAESSEVMLQREEALKQKLDGLIAQGKLGGYQALSNWVPSLQRQQQQNALIQAKLLADGAALSQVGEQLGEDANWLAQMRQHLATTSQALTLPQFLSTPAAQVWQHLWLGEQHGTYASIVALRGFQQSNRALLAHSAEGIAGVQWVDKINEISSVLGRYRQNMGWVVCGSYLLVWLLLLPRYRQQAWRVLLPTAGASLACLAILGTLGLPLQLFHVLAFMLLLGVGVDYGIFMQELPDRDNDNAWLAIGLSAFSTILSFGLLALSNTPALRAFGLTMLLGILFVWLLVPLFGKENKT